MKTDFRSQKEEIERQAKEAGLEIFYSGHSDSNGLSIYFKDINETKYRFSNHGISNSHRMETEKTFPLPFKKTMGVGGKITEIHNQLFN